MEILEHYRTKLIDLETNGNWLCLKIEANDNTNLKKWLRLISNSCRSLAGISNRFFFHRHVLEGLWVNVKSEAKNIMFVFYISRKPNNSVIFQKHLAIRSFIQNRTRLTFNISAIKPTSTNTLYDEMNTIIENALDDDKISSLKVSFFGALWGKNNKIKNK